MSVKFTNNAETTLASGINSSVTSLTVASSTGFPTITTDEYFYVTLDDGTNNEIVKVTAVSGTTWTIVRAQDNTTARSFSSSNKVELRVTAGLITDAVADALASSFAKNAFTGDGTETNFTLSQSPNSEDDLIVFIEGVFQNQSTYSLSGTTLTFSTAPANTRAIVVYTVKAAVSGANLNHDQFTASGSAAFTLSIAPINENNTQVFIDGVYQQKTDYAVSGTTLTFDTAPASGAIVEVMTFTQTEVNVPATGSVVAASIANDVNLNGNPTTTTQSAGNNTTRIATTAFVEAAVSNLIDSAPNTMNTLNEIAAALGDDPSFTTTVNNAIATKLPLAGGTMTGNLVVGGSGFTTTTINSTRTSGNIGGINFSASGTNKAQIYGTVDGQLKLGTGGDGTVDSNLALTIDAAGKVGIGTASPAKKLDVYSTDTISDIRVTAGSNAGIEFYSLSSDSSARNWRIGNASNSHGSLEIMQSNAKDGSPVGAGGTYRLVIDASGNVGIGTASPDNIFHIHDGSAGSVSAYADSHLIIETAQNNNFLTFLSPADQNQGILFGDADANYRGQVQYNHNGDNMIFHTAAAERMRIDAAGKIKAQVTGYYLTENTTDAFSITSNGANGLFKIRDEYNSADRLTILNNGNVGIKTSDPTAYYADDFVVSVPSEGGITIGAQANSHMNYLMFAESATSGAGGYRGYIGYSHNATTASGRMAINSQGLMHFNTSGTERMRIDAAGLMGIGSAPSNLTSEIITITTPASGGGQGIAFKRLDTNTDQVCGQIRWSNNSTDDLAFIKAKTDGDNTSSALLFFTNTSSASTEVMRINKNGMMSIGDTTGYAGGHDALSRLQLSGGGSVLGIRQTQVTDASHRVVAVFTDNGGTYRGRITINNSACSFTSASDYRLKENIETLPNGLDRLKQLKPVKFKWKEHDYTSEGFIAHEVQEIYPDAVVGEKDDAVMQSMDYGKITPLLVKAIQEQQTIIEDLKARIETLEG